MSFAGALTSDNIQDSRTFLFANTTDAQRKLQRNSDGIRGGKNGCLFSYYESSLYLVIMFC